jgi:predicted Zn finger-like uncharacterized protein
MALATQCPHCHTTFRVAHDQLKLRAGLVRCGSCKQIFNGIENLLRPEELERVSTPAPAQPLPDAEVPSTSSPSIAESRPHDELDFMIDDLSDPQVQSPEIDLDMSDLADAKPTADTTRTEAAEDPLQRMTLTDFSHELPEEADVTSIAADPDHPDPLDEAMADLQRKPLRRRKRLPKQPQREEAGRDDDGEEEEPGFMVQSRRRRRLGRTLRVFMVIASVVLLIALLAQATYVFRNQIAARMPQLKPSLTVLCARIGCQLGLPAQIDAVSIESNELQALTSDGSTFSLVVLLRNHGATPQAWPNIELTLNDTGDKPIARRVFLPRDYLTQQEAAKGFAPNSEQAVKLNFELTQLKAAGYRVYLFYP